MANQYQDGTQAQVGDRVVLVETEYFPEYLGVTGTVVKLSTNTVRVKPDPEFLLLVRGSDFWVYPYKLKIVTTSQVELLFSKEAG